MLYFITQFINAILSYPRLYCGETPRAFKCNSEPLLPNLDCGFLNIFTIPPMVSRFQLNEVSLAASKTGCPRHWTTRLDTPGCTGKFKWLTTCLKTLWKLQSWSTLKIWKKLKKKMHVPCTDNQTIWWEARPIPILTASYKETSRKKCKVCPKPLPKPNISVGNTIRNNICYNLKHIKKRCNL